MISNAVERDQLVIPHKGDVLVKVENISKKFCRSLKKSLWYGVQDISLELVGRKSSVSLRDEEFWAVHDVSFELRRGECLGLLGSNGAGKSTLLRMINGLIKPDRGRIETNGQVAGLIALGAGFNPILTGRENIYVYGSVLGFSKQEIDSRFDEIVAFSELEKYIDMPVQSYSSGMNVRLGFAIAVILLKPDILILDEVLAVGDRAFRAKCMIKVGELLNNSAVIFVSHQENMVQRICDSALWLEAGKKKAYGKTEVILLNYINENNLRDVNEPLPFEKYNEKVRSVSVKPSVKQVSIGHDISFYVEIFCLQREQITHFYLTVSDASNTCVARADIAGDFIVLRNQSLKFEVVLQNLRLGNGKYSVQFYGLKEAGKVQVFEIINACHFQSYSEVVSNISYMPSAYIQNHSISED